MFSETCGATRKLYARVRKSIIKLIPYERPYTSMSMSSTDISHGGDPKIKLGIQEQVRKAADKFTSYANLIDPAFKSALESVAGHIVENLDSMTERSASLPPN